MNLEINKEIKPDDGAGIPCQPPGFSRILPGLQGRGAQIAFRFGGRGGRGLQGLLLDHLREHPDNIRPRQHSNGFSVLNDDETTDFTLFEPPDHLEKPYI